jgi:hypothetical protein
MLSTLLPRRVHPRKRTHWRRAVTSALGQCTKSLRDRGGSAWPRARFAQEEPEQALDAASLASCQAVSSIFPSPELGSRYRGSSEFAAEQVKRHIRPEGA